MSLQKNELQQKCVNTIRLLAVDAVQKANSGHPGMPMGCAPIAHLLYSKILKHNPANPKWINRDRFILSAGHGSMLIYSALHLAGYDLSMDDLKNFRQWGSKTPGHPEVELTPGVETTTGPLGQGITNAIGMAAAYSFLSNKFNKDDIKILDHFIYVITSDGEIMEGISHEASSFAGHNKLGNLIVFYDDNKISIDGSLDLTMSENVAMRYEAYGWHVQKVQDGNNLDELNKAVEAAKKDERPSIIITRTHIGYGSPNKQDTSASHGAPLGEEEVKLTKKNLGFPETEFYIPEDVATFYNNLKNELAQKEAEWERLFGEYSQKYPQEAKEFKQVFSGNLPSNWSDSIPVFKPEDGKIATRSASGKIINAIADVLPTLLGGSADLAPSNNTVIKNSTDFSAENYGGRNFHYGVREHAMASMMNGMALYGAVIPFAGTFLVFTDYMRSPMRMAALMEQQVIFILTHDSIGLGEDGPTHQPVEHYASLRAIPNFVFFRPADANETAYAWQYAIENKKGPTGLALTRQGLPVFDRNKYGSAEGTLKGAYIFSDSDTTPDLIILATGSEVELAENSAEVLRNENIKVRVVSMPSWELFEKQSEEYKNSVLPKSVTKRISIEAGIALGWAKYVGPDGISILLEHFGASAPAHVLFEKFGFTVKNIVAKAKEIL